MNYTASRIFIVAFCSIFMVIGAISIGSGLLSRTWFPVLWGALFFLIPFFIMRGRLKQLATFQKMTYDWYKSEHPDRVQGNKVLCYSCGNSRIHARGLMNRTFHREHFCTQCGKTLYYSPERA